MLVGESVTLRTRTAGAPDVYGQPTYTWVDSTVNHVAVAPVAGREGDQAFRAELVDVEATLYLPEGTAVTAASRFVVRGVEFEVVGAPGDWRSPFTGWAPGVTVNVRRTEG